MLAVKMLNNYKKKWQETVTSSKTATNTPRAIFTISLTEAILVGVAAGKNALVVRSTSQCHADKT